MGRMNRTPQCVLFTADGGFKVALYRHYATHHINYTILYYTILTIDFSPFFRSTKTSQQRNPRLPMMAKKSRSESIKFENYKRLNGIESLVVLVLH